MWRTLRVLTWQQHVLGETKLFDRVVAASFAASLVSMHDSRYVTHLVHP